MATQLRYTPNAHKKDLIQQSLERIDNAVRRYGKQISSKEISPPFEFKNAMSHAQLREYLESEEGSISSCVQIGHTPLSNKNMYINKAFSENVTSSIAYDSENGDIENFTLGPAQFGNLNPFTNQKNASSKNLLGDFRRENERLQNLSKNRKDSKKHSSADRIQSKSKLIALYQKEVNFIREHLMLSFLFAILLF